MSTSDIVTSAHHRIMVYLLSPFTTIGYTPHRLKTFKFIRYTHTLHMSHYSFIEALTSLILSFYDWSERREKENIRKLCLTCRSEIDLGFGRPVSQPSRHVTWHGENDWKSKVKKFADKIMWAWKSKGAICGRSRSIFTIKTNKNE